MSKSNLRHMAQTPKSLGAWVAEQDVLEIDALAVVYTFKDAKGNLFARAAWTVMTTERLAFLAQTLRVQTDANLAELSDEEPSPEMDSSS